jgi:hypothetical protein
VEAVSTGSLVGTAVAAVVTFVVGGLWYSPVLFGRQWMAYNGLSEERLRDAGGAAKIFALSFLAQLVAAVNLAMFLGPTATIGFGAAAGFAVGFGWVAMSYATTYLFERRPLGLWFVNAGYNVVVYTLMGVIIAAFARLL